MLSTDLEDTQGFEPRPSFRHKRAFSGPSILTPSSTVVSHNNPTQSPLQAEHVLHDVAEHTEPMEPQFNLHYPMATATRAPFSYERPYTAQLFSFAADSPSSMYHADIYGAGLESRSSSSSQFQEHQNGSMFPTVKSESSWQVHSKREALYRTPVETGQAPFQQGSPDFGACSIPEVVQNATLPEHPVDSYYQHTSVGFSQRGDDNWDLGIADRLQEDYHGSNERRCKTAENLVADFRREGDFADEEADNSDGERQNLVPFQKRFFATRDPSSGGLPPHTSQGLYGNCGISNGRRVSDSRLSAQGLAEVLNLNSAEEALRRERFILNIFERELHYPLGYKTWVRDTSKEYRTQLLDQLHRRVIQTYPEYDKSVLETIIRRATYYMMQSRLRRERRARAKQKRDQNGNKNGLKDTVVEDNIELGFEHPKGYAGPAFVM
ncbi:LAFA_0F16776g1_1 [Lachancea sp. 'fantastica']|nr:LAFA_0F16776g1_1 [Lachancea sp. 'fantastica']